MSFKTTSILFAILIGMLGLLGLTLALKKTNVDTGAVFPSFSAKDSILDAGAINTVEIEQKGKDKLLFVKDEQGWRLSPLGLRINALSINGLIGQVTRARAEEDTDVTPNPETWGLTDPPMVVVLKKGTHEWRLKLGKQSPETNGVVYVMSSDRPNEVMAVLRSSLSDVVSFNLDKVWSRKLLTADPFTTQELTIRGPVKEGTGTKEKMFTLQKKPRGTYWFVTPAFGPAELEAGSFDVGGKPRDSSGVRGLLLAINDLQAEALEPLGEHDLKWYGLTDGAKVLRITVENARGRKGEENVNKETLLINVKKKAGKDGEQYYARLASCDAVFRVVAKKLEIPLTLLPEDGERLRSLQVIQIRPQEPDAVDIHTAREDLQLRRVNANEWKLKNASLGVQKADHVFLQQLLSELSTNHQVKAFLPSGKNEDLDKKLGFTAPTAVISIWVDGLEQKKSAETKDKKEKEKKKEPEGFPAVNGKPSVTLVFGSSGGKAYVKREVGPEIDRIEVPVALLKRAESPPFSYIDRRLPAFSAAQVTDIIRTLNGQTVEVARQAQGKPWKLNQPKTASAGESVDESQATAFLGLVAKLYVEEWVKVNPTKTDLQTYKLDNPRLKIELKMTIQGKKDPEVLAFSFGDSKAYEGKKTGVYCLGKLPDGRVPAVFFVAPATVQMLENSQLRNKTVFHFAPARAVGLKIAGWDDLKKRSREVQLDLKRVAEKPWEIAKGGPAGFKVDEQKVNAVVDALAELKLERFVEMPLAKEYDLKDKANRLLAIEITLENEKKAMTLVLGKQKGQEPFYYAESNALPGELFLLPAKTFPGLLTAPSWLDDFKERVDTK